MGTTSKDKTPIIKALISRYNHSSRVYVGDNAGDCTATHAAGIPFVWAAYGFGKNVAGADYTICSINELPSI